MNRGATDLGSLFHGAISDDGTLLYFTPDAFGLTGDVYAYSWPGLANTPGAVSTFNNQIEDLTIDTGDRLFWLEADTGDIIVYRFYEPGTPDFLLLANDGNGGTNLVWHPDTSLLYFLDDVGFHDIDPDTPGTNLITASLTSADVDIRTFVAVPGGIWARAGGDMLFIELDGTVHTYSPGGAGLVLSIPAPRPNGDAVFMRSDDFGSTWEGWQIDQALTAVRRPCLDVLADQWIVVSQSPDADHVAVQVDGDQWELT